MALPNLLGTYGITTPKATSGSLPDLVGKYSSASPASNVKPTTAPVAKSFGLTTGDPLSAVTSIWNAISGQFQSGVQQAEQPFKDKAAAGGGSVGQAKALSGAIDVGSGVSTALLSPLAPILTPIGQLIQKAGEGYATIPAVQKFGNSPAGLTTMNAADIIQKVSNVLGVVVGGAASFKGEVPKTPTKIPVKSSSVETPISVHNGEVPLPVENAPTVSEFTPLETPKTDIVENLKTQLGIYEDAQANDPAKDLLKFYGKNDPRYSNLDDIFSRNVGNGKSGSLDSKVTELGFNDVQQAHDAVIQYLDTRDTIAQMKASLASAKLETLPTTRSTTQTLKPIEGTGDIKTRGLSQGVEATAIEKQLTNTFGDLPEYKTISMADQAKQAADFITSDPISARAVALGEKAPPKGILPESVFVAAEQKAIAEGDVQGLRDLANSKLAGSATTMGQRIRTLGERDSSSPLSAIREVQDARAKAQAARGQTVDTEVAKAQKVIRQANTKQSWSSFVDSITC